MPLSHPRTVRHPALSAWQATLHQALLRREGRDPGLHSTSDHPLMQAAAEAAHEMDRTPGEPRHVSGEVVRGCAHILARMVVASSLGHTEEVARLRSQLHYESCDPLWLEAWADYHAAHILHPHRAPLYRRHARLDDFVLAPLPDTLTIALLADWGTGMPDAWGVLEQAAAFKPGLVLHLGDIYYAGTRFEVHTHFLQVCRGVFGAKGPRVYSLAGNHDRYAGGEGYELLLDSLGQPASYFCLRNEHWQLLAMDTGLHDANPRARGGTLTWLEPSEVEWLQHKLLTAGEGLPPGRTRGTLLLSHHPYFSFAGTGRDAAGHRLALNPNLREAFGAFVPEVDFWFWGHEHNFLVFAPYGGLRRGRCIGAAAVPRFVDEQVNAPVHGLRWPDSEAGPPVTLPNTRLANDGLEDFHAYAILRLEGPVATASYYQVSTADLCARPVPPAPPPLFSEQVVRPGP
ncbi:metallophosphoesterase [Myxococcaceae bacterium GXIMD 01537]